MVNSFYLVFHKNMKISKSFQVCAGSFSRPGNVSLTALTAAFLLSALANFPTIAADMPYKDADFLCFPQTDADRYVADFGIDLKSFGGNELCSAEVDTKKLLNDINLVEKGQFVTTGRNNLVKGFIDSANYYSWMQQQTYGVERGNDIPYATAYNRGGYFTMQDGWAKLSTLGRVGTFVHEARHTEGYRHVACNQGPYQGASSSACDRDYNYGGSHAVEMEYYARVSVQGINFHPVYKKMARLMAIARSNFVFNTTPLQAREGILALSMDRKQAYLYDRGQWMAREVPEVLGVLKRTSYGAAVFNGTQAFALEMYQDSGFQDVVGDTYSYFKLLMKEDKNTKDLEEFDNGTQRFVVHISKDNLLSAYDFPNGAWGASQQIPFNVIKTSTAIPGQTKKGLFLIKASGEIFEYQSDNRRIIKQGSVWDFTNQQVVKFREQNLILKNNGQIYVQSSQGLQIWPEAPLSYSDFVSVPLYDAFDVVKE